MRKIMLVLLLFPVFVFSQKSTISGTIVDQATGEQLIRATVFDPSSLHGTASNYYGFYSLSLSGDRKVTVIFSYVGYESESITFYLNHDTVLNVELEPTVTLKEFTVSDKSPQQTVENTQMSIVSLNPKQVKSMPVLFGEVDILKSLQMMPGVAGGTEGTAGIYVRGGGPDQNLYLLDGVPVYNVSHALGIFSVFNADAIKSVDLIKGGYPARYGGRLSSVVDIRMKEGNTKAVHGEVSLGLISSKFTIEGPIVKDKTSFIVSARRTYADLLAAPFIKIANNTDDEYDTNIDLYFYDLNAKINHKFSAKDRLYFSVYNGRDVLGVETEDIYSYAQYDEYDGRQTEIETRSEERIFFNVNWGNITSALRWNHIYNSKLFSNTTLTFTDYKFKTGLGVEEKRFVTGEPEEHEQFELNYYSQIRDFGLKQDFDFIPSTQHYIKFGGWFTHHIYTPGASSLKLEFTEFEAGLDTTLGNTNSPAQELALYAEDNWNVSNRLKVNVGLHYSGFLTGSKYYHSLQPRLSMRFKMDDNKSLKVSFSTMTQYLNLLASSLGNLPTDLWVPATKKVLPQDSWQGAIGGVWAINNVFEFTTEAYYKKMNNLVSYKEGESFFFLETEWEDKVTQGEGDAYGLELFFQKAQGDLTGWIGYTLSWSNRFFEDLNDGQAYPFKYDRRHDLSIVASYKINENWDVAANFQLNSGQAFTLYDQELSVINSSDTRYGYDEYGAMEEERNVYFFKSKNSYRMPLYHRMDFGVNYTTTLFDKEHKVNFSIYNVYARQNPTFVFPGTRYDSFLNRDVFSVRQFSLLPVPLPSITYTIKF